MNLIFKKTSIQFAIITTLVSFLFLKLNNFELYVDSYGYIENHVIRSSAYPLFLDVFNIFGKYQFNMVAIFQVLYTIFSFSYFVQKHNFVLKNNMIYFSYIIISLVFISNFSRGIITEAIALPTFVLFLTYIFQFEHKRINWPHYFIILLFLFVLLSIRNQFLFLIPTIMIYLWFKLDQNKTKLIYSFLLLIPVLLNGAIERNYHKIKHNQNVSSAYTGLQLLPSVIYNANLSDTQFIDDRKLRVDFTTIKKELKLKSIDPINMDSIHGESPQYLYTAYFNVITHRIIKPYFLNKYKHLKDENIMYVKMDQDCLNLFKSLTYVNYLSNFKLYFNLFKLNGFNNLFFLVLFMLLTIFTIKEFLERKNHYLLLVSISLISLLLNQILVTLVSFICYRYMVYNYIFFFLIILVTLNKFLKISKKELAK